MKRFICDFLRRGLVACGFGPVILAVVYLVLYYTGVVQTVSVIEVCVGIFSLTVLAFVAGGLNAIYQIERLPLMLSIFIHGVVLYFCYLATYIVNGWLERGVIPVIVFSAIFVVGYIVIWVIVYSIVKRNTEKLNEAFNKKRQSS